MCDWRYCSNAIDTNGTNQHDTIIYAYFILEWLVYPAWKRSKTSEVHSNKLSRHSQARNNNHPIGCMYAWWVYNTSHVGVGDVETSCSDHTPPYCFYTAAFIHYLLAVHTIRPFNELHLIIRALELKPWVTVIALNVISLHDRICYLSSH